MRVKVTKLYIIDFDLCHACFSIVKENHPEDHIFVTRLVGTQALSTDKSTARPMKKNKQTRPNYTTKAVTSPSVSSSDNSIPIATVQHFGVECDHCQSNIEGIRYKVIYSNIYIYFLQCLLIFF